MARKPNYKFERQERERLKADKKAQRVAEKRAAREQAAPPSSPDAAADDGETSH